MSTHSLSSIERGKVRTLRERKKTRSTHSLLSAKEEKTQKTKVSEQLKGALTSY